MRTIIDSILAGVHVQGSLKMESAQNCFQFAQMTSITGLGIALNLGFSAFYQISGSYAAHLKERLDTLEGLEGSVHKHDAAKSAEYNNIVGSARLRFAIGQKAMKKFHGRVTTILLVLVGVNVFFLLGETFDGSECQPLELGVFAALLALLPAPLIAIAVWKKSRLVFEKVTNEISRLDERIGG